MDYMDFHVRCPRKAVKRTHSLLAALTAGKLLKLEMCQWLSEGSEKGGNSHRRPVQPYYQYASGPMCISNLYLDWLMTQAITNTCQS